MKSIIKKFPPALLKSKGGWRDIKIKLDYNARASTGQL
jgi:hypothetical protein